MHVSIVWLLVLYKSYAAHAVQIRLLTDLFAVLIPGVQVDYPHRSIALTIAATTQPAVAFLPGKGARIAGSYETHVFVLPTGGDMHGAHAFGELPDGAIEVAVLETELSGVVDLQFKRSKVSDLEVRGPTMHAQVVRDRGTAGGRG